MRSRLKELGSSSAKEAPPEATLGGEMVGGRRLGFPRKSLSGASESDSSSEDETGKARSAAAFLVRSDFDDGCVVPLAALTEATTVPRPEAALSLPRCRLANCSTSQIEMLEDLGRLLRRREAEVAATIASLKERRGFPRPKGRVPFPDLRDVVGTIMGYLADERERVLLTRTSKAFLSCREGRDGVRKRLRKARARGHARLVLERG